MRAGRILVCGLVLGIIGAVIAGNAGFWAGAVVGAVFGLMWSGLAARRRRTPPQISPFPPVQPAPYGQQIPPRSSYQARARYGELRWVPPGEEIQVGGYIFNSGLVYACDGEPQPDEASAINTRLTVGEPARGDQAKLGYYSQYRYLSPGQRGNYLGWLSSGRKDEDPNARELGYVFLFFYGLERRLIVDGAQEPEGIAELVRLLHRYGHGRSLQSYACQLIHFWGWKQGPEYYAQLREWMDTLPVSLLGDDEVAIVLASLYQAGKLLPVGLAYDIAARHPEARRSVIVKRVNDEFKALFQKRYAERFGAGMPLKCAKSDSTLDYHAASPSLLQMRYRQMQPFTVKIPNVVGISSQFKPLVAIWDSCIEDLAGFSRVKAKKGAGASLRAHLALPPELLAQRPHPLSAHWESILANARRENGCLIVEAGEVAEMLEIAKRAKMTISQSREMAEAIQSLGYGVEPDPRPTGINYSWEEEIGVFRPNTGTVAAASANLLGAQFLLELCIFIAGADGQVSPEELAVSRNFIQSQVALTPEDLERLDTSQQVFVSNPAKAKSSIGRIAKRVPLEQRERIARLMVTIAAADNVVTKDEMRALEQVFRIFEMPRERLTAFLQEVRPDFSESIVQKAGPRVPGEMVPVSPGTFQIDMGRVAAIALETNDVIGILSKVMAENEQDAESETGPATSAQIKTVSLTECAPSGQPLPAWLKDLGETYAPLLQELIRRDSWSRVDFDALAKSFKVMPLGARDAINEWSDDHLGDFLLDGDDPIEINRQILPAGEPTNA